MKVKRIKKNQDKLSSKKRTYTPPSITIYGKLIELTTAKHGTANETTPPGNPSKVKP
jgi:hypothetical protein